MDKFPLMQGGVSVGELITEQEALYTWFEARCRLPGEGLWCALAVGDRGELRLGVLEPCGDRATIRRRFSARLTAPLGKLRQGEIRPAHPPEPEDWTPLNARQCASVRHGSGNSCALCRASLSGRSRGGGSWRCPMTRAAPFR